MAAKEKKKFEEVVKELERVVEQLESGELSLEDSLAAFENGVRLVKLCNQKLTEVERKGREASTQALGGTRRGRCQ